MMLKEDRAQKNHSELRDCNCSLSKEANGFPTDKS